MLHRPMGRRQRCEEDRERGACPYLRHVNGHQNQPAAGRSPAISARWLSAGYSWSVELPPGAFGIDRSLVVRANKVPMA